MPSIGDLDRRIRIDRNVGGTGATGQPLESWQEVATVWAAKRDVRGREFFEAQQVNAERTTRFVIRYRSDVTEKMRIVHDGNTYDVDSVIELERKRWQEIMTTARPAGG